MMTIDKSARDRLRSFVERIERIDDEVSVLREDQKDIYKEVKSAGFSAKALKAVIAKRKKDAAEQTELEQMMDLYEQALKSLPLFEKDEAA